MLTTLLVIFFATFTAVVTTEDITDIVELTTSKTTLTSQHKTTQSPTTTALATTAVTTPVITTTQAPLVTTTPMALREYHLQCSVPQCDIIIIYHDKGNATVIK